MAAVYRISLSNKNLANSGESSKSTSNLMMRSFASSGSSPAQHQHQENNNSNKLTTFAQVKACSNKEPLMMKCSNASITFANKNNNLAKSASTSQLLSSSAFGGPSSRASSNYVIKIPVAAESYSDKAVKGRRIRSSASATSICSRIDELDDDDVCEGVARSRHQQPQGSKTVSVSPGGKTVMTPEDPGRLRVYVPAADKGSSKDGLHSNKAGYCSNDAGNRTIIYDSCVS